MITEGYSTLKQPTAFPDKHVAGVNIPAQSDGRSDQAVEPNSERRKAVPILQTVSRDRPMEIQNVMIRDRVNRLKGSTFRSKFRLSDKDRSYINARGMDTIEKHAVDFIVTRIAPKAPKNDGRQTPMKNHPVFVAQHATATCCRNCLQRWHGIKKGKALEAIEVKFVVNLIMEWIHQQVEAAAER